MNDPKLAAQKFEELARLAGLADTEFEKAAVYAAAEALAARFREVESEFSAYALEKVESARWSIAAAVGYDVTNGHGREQHVGWAYAAASTLQNVIDSR